MTIAVWAKLPEATLLRWAKRGRRQVALAAG
jgi:hypothetical protein